MKQVSSFELTHFCEEITQQGLITTAHVCTQKVSDLAIFLKMHICKVKSFLIFVTQNVFNEINNNLKLINILLKASFESILIVGISVLLLMKGEIQEDFTKLYNIHTSFANIHSFIISIFPYLNNLIIICSFYSNEEKKSFPIWVDFLTKF